MVLFRRLGFGRVFLGSVLGGGDGLVVVSFIVIILLVVFGCVVFFFGNLKFSLGFLFIGIFVLFRMVVRKDFGVGVCREGSMSLGVRF